VVASICHLGRVGELVGYEVRKMFIEESVCISSVKVLSKPRSCGVAFKKCQFRKSTGD